MFSAHMRPHGIGPREPWSYGPQAEAAATGLPVQRPMALAFPHDRAARL